MPTRENKALERNSHIWFHRKRIKTKTNPTYALIAKPYRRENGLHIIAEVQNKRLTQRPQQSHTKKT